MNRDTCAHFVPASLPCEACAATVAALWEARAEIEKLREALNAIVPISCHQLHHDKQDRHAPGDPCPVEKRIEALKWGRSE